MGERTTLSIDDDVAEEARAHKGDRTWADLVLDGAHAPGARHDDGETAGRHDEGQDEPHPDALTADDIPLVADAVAERVENRLTRR